MKKIYLVRHAESEGNAGALIPHDNIIKITAKGHGQAEALKEILEQPKRIVVSKLIRTIETAEPTIKKFPESEVHLWVDTHEFDPIGPGEVLKMTHYDELDIYIEKFWLRLDPDERSDVKVETFREFTDRINGVILKLKKIPDGVNYVFTHGWFIKMMHLMTAEFKDFPKRNDEEGIYKKIMKRFHEFDKEFKTLNTGVYDMTSRVEEYGQ